MNKQVDTHMATARALRPWYKNPPDRRELTSAQIAIVVLADEVIRLNTAAEEARKALS